MHTFTAHTLFALVCASSLIACFDSDEIPDSDETGLEFRNAQIWEGCAEDPANRGALLDDWGCDGKPGHDLGCYMSEDIGGATLTICVPQLLDPKINATCAGVPTGPSSLVIGPSQGFCVPRCDGQHPCTPGYECSVDDVCAVRW